MMTKKYIIGGLLAACVGLWGVVSMVYRNDTPAKLPTSVSMRNPVAPSPSKAHPSQKLPTKKVLSRPKRRVADRPVSWMEMFPEAVNLDVYLQVEPKRYTHPAQHKPLLPESLDNSAQNLDEVSEQDDTQEDEHGFFFDSFKRRKVSYGACKATPLLGSSWSGDDGGYEGGGSYSPRSSSGSYSSQSRPSSVSGSKREFDSPSQSRFSQSSSPLEYHQPAAASTPSSHLKRDDWPSYRSPEEYRKSYDIPTPQKSDDIDPNLVDYDSADDGTSPDDSDPMIDPDFDGQDGIPDAQQSSFFGAAKEAIKTIMGPILGFVSPLLFNKIITPLWDSAYKLVSNWWNGAGTNAGPLINVDNVPASTDSVSVNSDQLHSTPPDSEPTKTATSMVSM